MAIEFKYRIHEVARDFGMTSKQITEIYTKYFTAPKNHMQILEQKELDVIFEVLTQKNQMESIAEVFAPMPPKQEKQTQSGKQNQQNRQNQHPACGFFLFFCFVLSFAKFLSVGQHFVVF